MGLSTACDKANRVTLATGGTALITSNGTVKWNTVR